MVAAFFDQRRDCSHQWDYGIGSRSWYNGAKLFQTQTTQWLMGSAMATGPFVPPARGYTLTPGGYVVDGPLAGTYFGPGGRRSSQAGSDQRRLYMQNGGAGLTTIWARR